MTFFKFPDEIEPYLIVGFLVIYLSFRLYPLLFSGKKPKTELPLGAPRDYGIPGGAVCPQCHRPFRLGWSTFKIGFGPKLARCEFCGKWSFVRRLSLPELRAAEAAELAEAQASQPVRTRTEAEKQSERIDESRYIDKK